MSSIKVATVLAVVAIACSAGTAMSSPTEATTTTTKEPEVSSEREMCETCMDTVGALAKKYTIYLFADRQRKLQELSNRPSSDDEDDYDESIRQFQANLIHDDPRRVCEKLTLCPVKIDKLFKVANPYLTTEELLTALQPSIADGQTMAQLLNRAVDKDYLLAGYTISRLLQLNSISIEDCTRESLKERVEFCGKIERNQYDFVRQNVHNYCRKAMNKAVRYCYERQDQVIFDHFASQEFMDSLRLAVRQYIEQPKSFDTFPNLFETIIVQS